MARLGVTPVANVEVRRTRKRSLVATSRQKLGCVSRSTVVEALNKKSGGKRYKKIPLVMFQRPDTRGAEGALYRKCHSLT